MQVNLLVYCRYIELPVVDKLSGDILIGIHDNGYEDAWIKFVENDMVQIQTESTKTVIVFRPAPSNLKRFRVGSIAPVTFVCVKEMDGECNLSRPYKLYVSSVLVEVIEIQKDLVRGPK